MLWEQPALLLSAMSKERPVTTSSSISDSMTKPGATPAMGAAAAAAAAAAATASSSSHQRRGSSSGHQLPAQLSLKPNNQGVASSASAPNPEAEGGVLSRFESFRRRMTNSKQQQGPTPPSGTGTNAAAAQTSEGSGTGAGAGQTMPPVVHLSGLGGLKYNAPGMVPRLSSGGVERQRTVSATGKFFSDDEAED